MNQIAISQSGVTADQFRQAFDALTEGFALFDADDMLVIANSSFVDGYAKMAHVMSAGMSWRMFLSEARRNGLANGLNDIDAHLNAGGETPLNVEGHRPGDRWVRIAFHPTRDGGFVLTETDITVAKSAEEMRGENAVMLAKVLDACAANLTLNRLDTGEVLYRTPAWRALFGDVDSTKDTYVDAGERADFVTDILAMGTVENFEARCRKADGTTIPARLSASLVEVQGEELLVTLTQDMTQLYRQRDEIRRQSQRLFDAVEALDQGLVIYDADDRLLVANRLWQETHAALGPAATAGAKNADLLALAVQHGLEPSAVGWDRDSDPAPARRFEFARDDGAIFEATRQQISDGGFVLAWRDVTEEKAAAAAVEAQREASFQTEKLTALGETLAGVAHELNNPLSVVVGQALMLREETTQETTLRRIERIAGAAERCSKIVKTFLAIARERPAQMVPVDLNEVVQTAIDVAAYSLRSRGAEVVVSLTDQAGIDGDEDQLAQVFVNLIVNAEHVLADIPEALLRITTEADDTAITVIVEDNGPGVPQDARSRIFEPFFTTKEIGQGTGVGLALSARIVENHGGRIGVADSDLGGAKFTVTLPASGSKASNAATPAAQSPATVNASALIVEDDTPIAEIVGEVLVRLGVETEIVATAEDAIARLAETDAFDLILSDLRMPGIGGLGLRDHIAANAPDLLPRLAFMTGDAMHADAEQLRQDTAHPLLEKPILPSDLARLVRQVLNPDQSAQND